MKKIKLKIKKNKLEITAIISTAPNVAISLWYAYYLLKSTNCSLSALSGFAFLPVIILLLASILSYIKSSLGALSFFILFVIFSAAGIKLSDTSSLVLYLFSAYFLALSILFAAAHIIKLKNED